VPAQVPPVHASLKVLSSPSLHGVPSGTGVELQVPLLPLPLPPPLLHASTVHSLWSSHAVGAAMQPSRLSQLSVLHASPSSQVTGVWTQPSAGSHESLVHASLSSHGSASC